MEDAGKIINLLEKRLKKDLSCYDVNFLLESFNSRVNEYMGGDYKKYLADLKNDPAEQNSLYTGLFVPHSLFFRDRLSFSVLEELLITRIHSRKKGEKKLRIWSAGCAGGEEAYSLAIILAELAEKGEIAKDYRIFATDSMEKYLETAREGIYSAESLKNVRLELVDKHFVRRGEEYEISRRLKERVHFSGYDLLEKNTQNPPESIFGEFDLISCCNVFIYYNKQARKRILDKIKGNLASGGYLLTGRAESGDLGEDKELVMYSPLTSIYGLA